MSSTQASRNYSFPGHSKFARRHIFSTPTEVSAWSGSDFRTLRVQSASGAFPLAFEVNRQANHLSYPRTHIVQTDNYLVKKKVPRLTSDSNAKRPPRLGRPFACFYSVKM